MSPTVYVVHCIDAEGPLYESLEATFERLKHIFHLDLPPDRKTLSGLQEGSIDLGGIEEAVRKVVDPHLLEYNDTWDKVDAVLADALSEAFRERLPDTRGNGWVYNWFCVDHVDYDVNPRRRDIGYHNVFDHYAGVLRDMRCEKDGLQFHFHPHPFLKQANLCATHWWANSDALYQILNRRIIDRKWFPGVNRPGFQVNRPDSHWFLEQFVPFDYASLAMASESDDEEQFDFSKGRSGDWRRAPRTWRPYHPSHDDYQVEGSCRRWIARCLNVGTRSYLLTEEHVRQAFEEARAGIPVVMAFADHDFRDFRRDVEDVRELLAKVDADFPDVAFEYSDAVSALRHALALPDVPKCALSLDLQEVDGGGAHVLTVRSDTPTFGPQPYLAFKTLTQTYHHDNLDFQVPGHEWTYVFDSETMPLAAIESVGVAANNAIGTTSVAVLDTKTAQVERHYWNEVDGQ